VKEWLKSVLIKKITEVISKIKLGIRFLDHPVYADCLGLSVVNSAQWALEMCLAAQSRQKIHKTPIFAFNVIQGH